MWRAFDAPADESEAEVKQHFDEQKELEERFSDAVEDITPHG